MAKRWFMKNFRVFKTVREKGIISGFSVKNLGMILFFLLGVPYLITLLFGNLQSKNQAQDMQENVMRQLMQDSYAVRNKTHLGEEVIPLELYVADKLARTADQEWELEALKAQAILIRTELHRQMQEEGVSGLWADGERTDTVWLSGNDLLETEDENYGSRPVFEKAYQAVAETAGLCVMFQDQFVIGAYFAVSSGMTRSASWLELSEYPYLQSVICEKDFLSEEYYDTLSFSESEFWKIWEEIPEEGNAVEREDVKEGNEPEREDAEEGNGPEREDEGEGNAVEREDAEEGNEPETDSAGEENMAEVFKVVDTGIKKITYVRDRAGYVLYLKCDEKRISGEDFRRAYHLASADFYLSREGKDLLIATKGKGHGLGMSQYQACQMAKEGESATQILEYFFADVTITKIE